MNENLSNELGQMRTSPESPSDWQLFEEWITFHQSYATEEFVEGIRPVMSEEEFAAVTFEVTPGVLMRIAARASVDPENDYVLVIDEMTRATSPKSLAS